MLSPAEKVTFGLKESHNVDRGSFQFILDRLVKILFIFTRKITLFTREVNRSHVKSVQRRARLALPTLPSTGVCAGPARPWTGVRGSPARQARAARVSESIRRLVSFPSRQRQDHGPMIGAVDSPDRVRIHPTGPSLSISSQDSVRDG